MIKDYSFEYLEIGANIYFCNCIGSILVPLQSAYFFVNQDQILRKPNGLAWVLFADAESVQRAVEYYNSGQAFMYGTPFVISSVNVDVIADTDMEENALAKARFVFLIVSLTMKTFNYILTFFVHFSVCGQALGMLP